MGGFETPMSRVSAGLLMYQVRGKDLHVFLAHPGGPFFRRKDAGYWTIPKGELEDGEDLLAAAQREFTEETGIQSCPPYLSLGSIRQKGGKVVHAWAFAGEWNGDLRSNHFEMEWPPRSGKTIRVPEVDRAQFFPVDRAKVMIKRTQVPLIDRLLGKLAEGPARRKS